MRQSPSVPTPFTNNTAVRRLLGEQPFSTPPLITHLRRKRDETLTRHERWECRIDADGNRRGELYSPSSVLLRARCPFNTYSYVG